MRMQAILGLVLVTTGVSHLMPRDFSSNRAPDLLERAATKVTITVANITVPGETPDDRWDSGECSAAQIKKLQSVIPEARSMLENAVNALAYNGVENSPAYKDWFGKQKAATTKSIKTHNFQAPLGALGGDLLEATRALTPGQLNQKGVTFTCWPRNDPRCDPSGYYRWVAGTKNPGPPHNGDFTGPLIGLCPIFFNLPTLDEVKQQFNPGDPSTGISSAALTLVHEMQHVVLVTGKRRNCTDLKTESGPAYDTAQ